MKENKSFIIKFRLTENQKTQVENYAAAHNLNISEVVRLALNELFGGNKNGK